MNVSVASTRTKAAIASTTHRWSCGGLALVTAALVATAAQATEARYACSGGTTLTARFSPPSLAKGRVTLDFGSGDVVTLPQAPSADGGRYAGWGVTFWIKGRTATLTRAGATETCATR